jgi:hypothetical protein
MHSFRLVPAAEGPRREFKITFGLRAGYGSSRPEWMMRGHRRLGKSCSATKWSIRQFAAQPIGRADGPLSTTTRRLTALTKSQPSGHAISDSGPRFTGDPRPGWLATGTPVAGSLLASNGQEAIRGPLRDRLTRPYLRQTNRRPAFVDHALCFHSCFGSTHDHVQQAMASDGSVKAQTYRFAVPDAIRQSRVN